MFLILFVTWLPFTCSLVQKETILNAQITSQNGASIIHNPSTTTVINTTYHIVVGHQEDDYDLKLSLNNSWSFKPSITSSITLTIDGFTPIPTMSPPDADILIVFAVNDWQYFSFFIHLDSYSIKSRIFQSISLQNITNPVSQWMSDNTIHSRWDRISNNDQWVTMHDWNGQALWPLKYVITNDPNRNISYLQFYHNTTVSYATGYTFDASFVPNKDIDIYIMGDSTNERYDVSSIHVQLSDTKTLTPTRNPTATPTVKPTETPTMNPTPTMKPTINPSLTPTKHPSSNPTSNPSLNPTENPTLNPSVNPTENPSLNPSLDPTSMPSLKPSLKPTSMPSFNPSLNPSLNPSSNPSSNPSANPSLYPSSNPSLTPTSIPSLNPSFNPTDDPSLDPTESPSATKLPTAHPTHSPTFSPTHNPTEPTYSPTNITIIIPSTTSSQEINYGVVIIITFQYKFSSMDKDKIIIILHQITETLNDNQECAESDIYSPIITERGNVTIVNATIFVCDEAEQTELLTTVSSPTLQTDIITKIDEELDTHIVANKTSIEANDIIIYTPKTTQLSNDTGSKKSWLSFLTLTEENSLLYMMIFVGIQLIVCCLLIACIGCIYAKTRTLKRKQSEIKHEHIHLQHQMYENKLQIPREPGSGSVLIVDSVSNPESNPSKSITMTYNGNASRTVTYKRNMEVMNGAMFDDNTLNMPLPKINKCPKRTRRGVSEDMYDPQPVATTKDTDDESDDDDDDDMYGPDVDVKDDEINLCIKYMEESQDEGSQNAITPRQYIENSDNPQKVISVSPSLNPPPVPTQKKYKNNKSEKTAPCQLPKYQVTKRQWM